MYRENAVVPPRTAGQANHCASFGLNHERARFFAEHRVGCEPEGAIARHDVLSEKDAAPRIEACAAPFVRRERFDDTAQRFCIDTPTAQIFARCLRAILLDQVVCRLHLAGHHSRLTDTGYLIGDVLSRLERSC